MNSGDENLKDTPEECLLQCKATAGCKFVIWKTNKQCWLKSKKSNTVVEDTEAVYVPVECSAGDIWCRG